MSTSQGMVPEGLHRVDALDCELRYFRAGQGSPVVLMHTLRTQLEYFDPLVRALDPDRIDAIVVDLPGHGESTAPRVKYTAMYFADVIEHFLEACDIKDAIVGGESTGATIGLLLAARRNPRVRGVISVNAYDYGRRGGARRNSLLANVIFSLLLVPGVGAAGIHTEMKWQIRSLLRSGLHDPAKLSPGLVDRVYECGKLPGHHRAFRSLMLEWRSWIAAREQYPLVEAPVTLAYADGDWSRAAEREENARALPGARTVTIANAGHFACLDQPDEVARLIHEAV